MKKVLSVLLAILLIVTVSPMGIFEITASAATEDYYTYTVSNGKATITDVDTAIRGDVSIPDALGGYPVDVIGAHAFYECNSITGVTIPDGVTTIEVSAFYGCYQLAAITIPDSVTSIDGAVLDYTAFYTDINNWKDGVLYAGNHLIEAKDTVSGEYTIKDGTKTIAAYAFSECENITRIIIPDSVTTICTGAFLNCFALKDIIIPASVTTVENSIFGNNYVFECMYYMGSKAEKDKVIVGDFNEEWYKITVYYNSCIAAELHTYEDNNDTVCDVCGFVRMEWQISRDTTGVYDIKPSQIFSGFNKDSITVSDKNGDVVVYNGAKYGWPLVAGQTYTVVFNKEYGVSDDMVWSSINKAVAIFPDTPANQWYSDAVTYSVGRGLISGYGATGMFGTADSIQRQDFLVILARLDGVDLSTYANKGSKFPDVVKGSYYEAAVSWGVENGITTGYQNGKFGVGDKITREQLVTFLYRYANHKNLDTSYTADEKSKVKNTYSDYKKVTNYAIDPVVWAVTNGVISGKTATTIVPGGNALRCEVAQIMYNIFLNDIFKVEDDLPADDDSSLEGTKIIFASTVDPKDDGTDYVISKIEKEYGINVEIIVPTLENYVYEMQALIAAGKSPTVGRSAGDAPVYLGYFQSLDAAQLDYTDPIWDQRMFKLSTYNGSPYLCNTLGNFWTEADIVVYSKSLLKKANCYTPEELDAMGKWNFDTYLEIGQVTAKLDGCNGASVASYDTLLHMSGGAVYKTDSNNRMVNGIDENSTEIFQKIAQGFKDNALASGGVAGLINGSFSITTTGMWSLRTDGNLVSYPNWSDLGFYYLPSYEDGGERYVTGQLRGWGIMKGCNNNPATGAKAAEAGGVFLREYLDVSNYSLDTSFISEEAKTFFFKMCSLYAETDNYNPYYTTYNLNEDFSGLDDDREVYRYLTYQPDEIPSLMPSIKASVQKGVENLNKYIDQNT